MTNDTSASGSSIELTPSSERTASIPDGFTVGKGPYSQRIGPLVYRREQAADGLWTGWVGVMMEDHHIGANQRGHGGLMLTLLDEAMGLNAFLNHGNTPVVTVSLTTHFIAATLPGHFLKATGRVVRATRSLAFIEGEAWCGDTLVGTASGVWKYLKKSDSSQSK
ncbi:thioesterase superfamily protein [gamma proteobacterium HdN1]|nr:thioesterase superfamily protein [gamma proteobacterium HdN1]